MSQSIEVAFSQLTHYPVYIGEHLWDDFITFCDASYSTRKLFVVIDANVNRLHGQEVKQQCARYFDQVDLIEIPAGEPSKSIAKWEELQDALLQKGAERTTPLLAVGGGVTGDLAGFAAASVLRGIPLIHMPTSLLAMVDSSIGGKTGVNHRTGKNLVGAFYQPDAVFACTPFLETLPRREWVGGLAEMLKYAAINKPDLFEGLGQAVKNGFKPSSEWTSLIRQSAAIKIAIVQDDVREAGKRAFLNFGHTFGHALEKKAGFGSLSHGEAVFVGMLAATYFSEALGAPVEQARFNPFIPLYDINLDDAACIDELIELMKLDKKIKEETIRLILLHDWGQPYIKRCNDTHMLKEAWLSAWQYFS